jgi:hypothetical protein
MATVDLGALRFNWRGAYAGGTAYVVDDVVSSGGASYVCILASTGNATSDGTYWSVMSSAGTNGTNGTNGTDLGTVITTQGDIAFRDGSGLQRLAKGTAAQALKINAGATAPEWVTNSFVNADINASAAIDPTKLAGLDATPSADHTANGPQTNTLNAGYGSAIMDLVYLNANGKWLEADADATATSINLLGMALEAKTDGQAMIGVPLYVSGTLGAITETKPTGSGDVVRTVGYSVTADIIFFAPSSDYVTLA